VNQIRHLIDSRAANQIGPSGCWLLSVLSVSGRAEWWDDELAGVTGLGSRSTLGRVRQACIDAGFLRYDPGARGRPAVYSILSKFDAESGQNVTQNPDIKRAECDAESGQKPQVKKRKGVTASVGEPSIPQEFDTEAFREAWKNWILYRSEKRKPVSVRAAKQQLQAFAGWIKTGASVGDLVASIEQSIANDWQGLFEPRGGSRQVVDRQALANFLRAGDGSGDIREGDGIPAGSGASAGGGGNPQRLLAFAAGPVPGGAGGSYASPEQRQEVLSQMPGLLGEMTGRFWKTICHSEDAGVLRGQWRQAWEAAEQRAAEIDRLPPAVRPKRIGPDLATLFKMPRGIE